MIYPTRCKPAMTSQQMMEGMQFDATLRRALAVQDALDVRAQAIQDVETLYLSIERSCAVLRSQLS